MMKTMTLIVTAAVFLSACSSSGERDNSALGCAAYPSIEQTYLNENPETPVRCGPQSESLHNK